VAQTLLLALKEMVKGLRASPPSLKISTQYAFNEIKTDDIVIHGVLRA